MWLCCVVFGAHSAMACHTNQTTPMFTFEAILADNIRQPTVNTRMVVTSQIENRKRLSAIIAFLNETIPLNQFALTHLKRVNSKVDPCQVIIAPAIDLPESHCDDSDLIQKSLQPFGDKLQNFLNEFNLSDLKVQNVASTPPLTKIQFDSASVLWPVNFHEDKYISKCLNGTLFSSDQMKDISNIMTETLQLVKSATDSHPNSCRPMSAIIVKDNRKFQVTKAVSNTESCPLDHAAIMAIEQVAEIHMKAKSGENESCSELAHFEEDYLCTGYECFLSQDPCLMCAMALVHSRIKRVFIYSGPDLQESAECNDRAYAIHKLHILEQLNHHYEVWRLSPVDSSLSLDDANKEHFPNKKAKVNQ